MDSIQNPELRTWAETKGWKDPGAVVQSAQHLEKMLGGGVDGLVRVGPSGLDLNSTAPETFAKLGVPASAADYNLELPAGQQLNESAVDWARGQFAEAKLTNQQANKLLSNFIDFENQQVQARNDALDANRAAGDQTLQREWGAAYNTMVQQGRAAIRTLGMSDEAITGMEQTIGYEATMKWAAEIGGKLGEKALVDTSGAEALDAAMTPDRAKQQYEKKLEDAEWVKALMDRRHPGHKAAIAEKADLFAVMYPEAG